MAGEFALLVLVESGKGSVDVGDGSVAEVAEVGQAAPSARPTTSALQARKDHPESTAYRGREQRHRGDRHGEMQVARTVEDTTVSRLVTGNAR
ncbi:MAG: hypothetical protein JST53_00410 [Actinobacteria bacterium]|nr:hypothetical protein [Actinomycetota bacterium]